MITIQVTVMMMTDDDGCSNGHIDFHDKAGGGHDQADLVVTVITDGSCRLVTTMSTDNDGGIKRHLLTMVTVTATLMGEGTDCQAYCS